MPLQPPLLGHGVAPPGRCLWPQEGVAPLGCALRALTAARALRGWNVRSMNQGKFGSGQTRDGKSELKWTGMVEFNSDDHYIYYCGQESLRRNGLAIIVKKESKMQYFDAISKMTE